MSRKVFKEPLLKKADIDREWSIGLPLKNQDHSEQQSSENPISTENTIQVTFFKRSKGTSAPGNENL